MSEVKYTVVDKEKYYRLETYNHFTQGAKCSFSMTDRIDVTELVRKSKETGTGFYINFLWLLSKALNSREDFRLSYLYEKDELILFDKINPEHYVFHKDTETFTVVHTEYDEDYRTFYERCEADIEAAEKTRAIGFSDNRILNNYFDASCIPWRSYDSMNIELPDGYLYYTPITNWGRYEMQDGRLKMPLTLRVNHAVCDGYHACRVFDILQEMIDEFSKEDKKQAPKLNLVLVEPRIPQNTGNISRTCAVTGATLHLIKPYGFEISDRNLKRAGLDYWDELEIYEYNSLDDFFSKVSGEFYYFTTKGRTVHSDVKYPIDKDVYLFFGREDAGLPESLLYANPDRCVRIPMRPDLRSLNLSNSVAIAVYETLRQWDYPDLGREGKLTQYEWDK